MSIIGECKSFLSANGIDNVKYYIRRPDGEIKAVVQVIHGMCDSFSKYEELAEYLCSKGFAVIGHDQLGHGATAAEEEDLGYFAPEHGWIYLVKDARTVTLKAYEEFENLPVFILGHSMGSLVARAYMSRWSCDIAGAILLGTVGRHTPADAGIMLTDSVIAIHGDRYRSKKLCKLLLGLGSLKIADRKTEWDWLSTDESVVSAHTADKWSNFTFTASAFRDLFMLVSYNSSRKWYSKVRRNIPILLMGGSEDPVCSYGKAITDIFNGLCRRGFTDVEAKICSGCRHELIHEYNKEKTFDDIADWISKRI